MATPLDKDKVVALLNRLLEAELAGVVRYTHSSFLVFGFGRIPIVSWLREQAQESLLAALPGYKAGRCLVIATHSAELIQVADRVLVLSARPGRVKLDLPVDLPRPRTDEMRYTAHFGRLAKRLKEAIE